MMSCPQAMPHLRVSHWKRKLRRAQRPNRIRGLRISLPLVMSLVAHLARQGGRQAGGRRQNQQVQLPGNASILPKRTMPPVLLAGMIPSMPFVHLAFGTGLAFYMPPIALICRPDDMLSSPLGKHILDYEPPRGFVIPAFSTFDGSVNPYDHMLHYNQAMILNADNDHLLCKVFPASLQGPHFSLVP